MTLTHTALSPPQASAKEQQQLWRQVADLRVAMLTTTDGDGSLSARPVSTLRVEPDGTLWYFIAADGGIAADVQRDSRVHLCFMDIANDVYVWLHGGAAIVDDRAKVKDLWSALAGVWFPGGPDDRKLALLRVIVDRGDYWDVDSSKLVQFFALAKAALTIVPPEETVAHKQFAR